MRNILIVFSFLSCFLVMAKEKEVNKSYLLDIRIPEFYNQEKRDQFNINLCLTVQDQINRSEESKVNIKCDFKQELNPNNFHYNLSFYYLGDRIRLTAKINKTKSLIKDLTFSWNVKNNTFSMKKIIHRFVEFKNEKNILNIENYAFNAGIKLSNKIDINDKGNYFLKKTNQIIPKNQAKNIFINEGFRTLNGEFVKKNKQYIRSYLEVGGMLLAGGSFYQLLDFDEDKDFNYNWQGVKDKFTTGLRFDDNSRFYNFYAHPFVGAIYQVMARSRGLSRAEGYLLAFISSAVWEYGPEFVEVASINDQFQTAFAGPVVGNVLFDINQFLQTSGHNSIAGIFKNLFFAQNNKTTPANLDKWGFNTKYWHQIDIFTQAARTIKSSQDKGLKDALVLKLNFKLDTIKKLEEAGKASKFLWDNLYSELAIDLGQDKDFKHDVYILTKSVLFGLAKKKILLDKEKRKRGYSFILGASSEYEVKEGDIAGKFDKYAIVNILGPSLDIRFFIKGLKIRMTLDVYANFSSIRSFAIERYLQKYQDQIIAATLEKHKYYNGYGMSQNARLSLFYKNFGIDLNWRHNKTWSINGMDRNWNEITDNLRLTDSRSRFDSNLFLINKVNGLKLGIGYEYKNAISLIESSLTPEDLFINKDNEHIIYFNIGFNY